VDDRCPEAPDRLVGDPDHGQEQQEGLDEGGQVLGLAMAVAVLRIGRLPRQAHGEEGQHRRGEVEGGVGGLGEDAEAAGQDTDGQLHRDQPDRAEDREERDPLLLSLGAPLGRMRRGDELLCHAHPYTSQRGRCVPRHRAGSIGDQARGRPRHPHCPGRPPRRGAHRADTALDRDDQSDPVPQ